MQRQTSGRGRPSRQSVYERLTRGIAELRERMGGLPSPVEAESIWTTIWHQEAHHSTALEGNTLVMKQVELLLSEGRAVGSRELKEYLEVTGYADAAQWVYGQGLAPGDWSSTAPVTITEIRHIHELALGPVWGVAPHPSATREEAPGSYRKHDIQAFPGGMTPPEWVDVGSAMTDWVADLSAIDVAAEPIEAIAIAHASFERIHPFLDGNGRTGRLVLNLILVRFGYPPAIIYKRDRTKYLGALRRADAGDPGPLAELIARSVTDNLYRFVVPAVAGPRRMVPIAALARHDLKVTALREAVRSGRCKGLKGDDGQWRSTRVWVDEYLANRYKRKK